MNRQLLLIIGIGALLIGILVRNLNPLSDQMFDFHDQTQPGRIDQFVVNIQNGVIPPRLAPEFSYNLGYPVFNFYAPFAYWVTSIPHLAGLSIAASLKLSFALAIITAATGMFLLLRKFHTPAASMLGAGVYITIPYMAAEIFVRGNLGEIWFLALLPWTVWILLHNDQKFSAPAFIASTAILSALFTVHNIMSLLSIVMVTCIVLLLQHRIRGIVAMAIALLLSSYFLIPAVVENTYTYAQDVAVLTRYEEHFLCISQLWNSPWGYGGSTAGCEFDGMSFQMGKLQILLALAGGASFVFGLYQIYRKKKKFHSVFTRQNILILSIALVTALSAFLTLYQSKPVWDLLRPVLSLFQFPWRFLPFIMFGIAFFSAYSFLFVPKKFQFVIATILVVALTGINMKYFYKEAMTVQNFNQKYLSEEYIKTKVVYFVAEYLPRTASFNYWYHTLYNTDTTELVQQTQNPVTPSGNDLVRITENYPFEKSFIVEKQGTYTLNIHYFPNWQIRINGRESTPESFDKLGRPQIPLSAEDTVSILYRQTPLQHTGNILTICGILLSLTLLLSRKKNKLLRTVQLQ